MNFDSSVIVTAIFELENNQARSVCASDLRISGRGEILVSGLKSQTETTKVQVKRDIYKLTFLTAEAHFRPLLVNTYDLREPS